MTTNQCKKPADRPATDFTGAENEGVLMTLDPGHFHASLLQKYRLPQVAPGYYVYAPDGIDVQRYLNRINNFNTRNESLTKW